MFSLSLSITCPHSPGLQDENLLVLDEIRYGKPTFLLTCTGSFGPLHVNPLYKRSRSLTLEHLGPGGQDGLVALELPPAAEEDSVRELRILESGAEVLAQSTLGNLNTR